MAQLKLNFSIVVEKEDIDKPVRELLSGFLDYKDVVSDGSGVPATSKQVKYLKRLGYKGNAVILTKREASEMISELEAKL